MPVAFLLLCTSIAPALDRRSQVTATVSVCSVGKGSFLSGNSLFRLICIQGFLMVLVKNIIVYFTQFVVVVVVASE